MPFPSTDLHGISAGLNLTTKGQWRILKLLTVSAFALGISGCSNIQDWVASPGPFMPGQGPSNAQISKADSPIPVVDVTDEIARRQAEALRPTQFSQIFASNNRAPAYLIGSGDTIEISIWEAPPAVLFTPDLTGRALGAVGVPFSLPSQMVSADGVVTVPFVGNVNAAGRTPQQVEEAIRNALRGKANNPQIIVRVTGNATSNITVVGDVGKSARLPLTAKGERLLDVLALAGGTSQPMDKMMIQLSRGTTTATMPLDVIIRDPSQNIMLMPGDVITALYQTNSFVALGATGSNREVNFEAKGISLAQALGRIGGVQGSVADPNGVFIFRYENPAALPASLASAQMTPDMKVPVIYRVDLKQPSTFLVAQSFAVQNKDVIFVSMSPLAELQMFVNVITSFVYPAATVITTTK